MPLILIVVVAMPEPALALHAAFALKGRQMAVCGAARKAERIHNLNRHHTVSVVEAAHNAVDATLVVLCFVITISLAIHVEKLLAVDLSWLAAQPQEPF
jgi:hypothetical protein